MRGGDIKFYSNTHKLSLSHAIIHRIQNQYFLLVEECNVDLISALQDASHKHGGITEVSEHVHELYAPKDKGALRSIKMYGHILNI